MSTLQQFHVDQALTNVSVDFSNNGNYIAEQVAPLVPVLKQSDFYFVFSKEKLRRFNTTIAPGADFPRIDLNMDKRGYFFENGHGLEYPIPDQLRSNADPATQLDVQATKTLTEDILIDQEYNLAQVALNTTTLSNAGASGTTLSTTAQWSDFINSDPIPVIDAAKVTVANNIARYPNAMAINDVVYLKLRNHPKVIDRFKYTSNGVRTPLSQDELRQALGLDYLFVGTARYNSAPEGEADALTSIWPNNAYLFYRPTNPGLMEPAFMYTFLWTGQGFGQLMARYREQWRVQDVLQIQKYYIQQYIAIGAVYYWLNASA